MADRGLRQVECIRQVADACLAARMRGHQRHQPQPYRISQCLQQWRNQLSLPAGQRLARQRRAARRRVSRTQHPQRLRHTSILTELDVLWQARRKARYRQLSKSHVQEVLMSRVQLALNVNDIDEAVAFYSRLFGAQPAKRRPGYANFAIAEPPLKLVLLENPGHGGSLNHLGVEVSDTDIVDAEQKRLAQSGLASVDKRDTTCCYARQDKFWVQGAPDGESWEIYTVLADSQTFYDHDHAGPGCCGADGRQPGESAAACC